MFQGDSSRHSNKTLVSRGHEGSRSMRLPLKPVTSRSSEDLLRDSWPSAEEMVDEPQEVDRDLTKPDCVSPSLPCAELSTGSSVLDSLNSESLTCNSALESPDSWADSDSAVVVETFGENQRVCSVCDSRTCSCVKPVVISTPDEGFIPSTEEEPQPVDNGSATTESSTDKVIYFQRSSEKTQEEFQDLTLSQEAAELKREEENPTLVSNPAEELTECDRVEVPEATDSERVQVDSGSFFPNDDVLEKKAGPCKSVEGKNLISCDDGTETATLHQHEGDVEVPAPEETGEQNVRESLNSVAELFDNQDENHLLNSESRTTVKSPNQSEIKPSKDVEPGATSDKKSFEEASFKLQGSCRPLTPEAPAKVQPAPQEQTSPTTPGPNHGKSSTLPSTSTEPEEDHVERTGDMGINLAKENQDSRIESFDQTDVDDRKDSGVFFFTVIEHDEPTASSLDNTNIIESNKLCEDVSQIQENTTEQEQEECSYKSDTDVKGNLQSDSMENECGPNRQDEQPDQKLNDGTICQQDTLDPDFQQTAGEEEFISAETERNDSQVYDSVGDSVEPMDIFYPEKEEPVSFEPTDLEIQGWPLVLSVAALQPAPATDMLPDGQALNLGEDLLNAERQSEQVVDKVNAV